MLPSSPLKNYISGFRLQELQIPSDEESVSSLPVLRGFFTRSAHCCGFFNGLLYGPAHAARLSIAGHA